MKTATPETIAKACHEVNRAYCAAIGDDSQKPWDDAADWQKHSAINGVQYALRNPTATPAMMHESWMAQKKAEGWVYGETKDEQRKTHPCMVEYHELPETQRAKDHLFRAVVEQFRDLLP